MIHSLLCFHANLAQARKGILRIVTLAHFVAEADAVGTVHDAVCNINGFLPAWTRGLDHRVERLRINYARLSSNIRFFNHPLLCDVNFLERKFKRQLRSDDHDTVRSGQDLVIVLQGLLAVDFCDDLNGRFLLIQKITDAINILSLPDRGRRNKIDFLLNGKVAYVMLVLFR